MTLSRQQFTQVLFHWLSLSLNDEAIQRTGEQWRIVTWTPDLRRKFKEELLAIQTWILVDACQVMFPNRDVLYPLLDSVHSLVYEQLAGSVDIDYRTWGMSLAKKWDEYNAAMASNPKSPFWELAKKIDTNLFGGCRRDFQAQNAMMIYIEVTMKHFNEALGKYADIHGDTEGQ